MPQINNVTSNSQPGVEKSYTFNLLKYAVEKEIQYHEPYYLCTIRGLARLLDMSSSTFTDSRVLSSGAPRGILLKLYECSTDKLPDSLKPVAGFNYKIQSYNTRAADTLAAYLPDMVVSCLVKYYATESRHRTQRAKQLDLFFNTVGVRSFFSKIAGDELVQQPVTEVKLLPAPPVLEELTTQINPTPARTSTLADLKEILDLLPTKEQKQKALIQLLNL